MYLVVFFDISPALGKYVGRGGRLRAPLAASRNIARQFAQFRRRHDAQLVEYRFHQHVAAIEQHTVVAAKMPGLRFSRFSISGCFVKRECSVSSAGIGETAARTVSLRPLLRPVYVPKRNR